MKFGLPIVFIASLLAACGGGGSSSSPHAPLTPLQMLIATPSALSVNLLGGTPKTFTFTIASPDGSNLSGVQWSATNLSFLSASLQNVTPTSAVLTVRLLGAGTSTITVRDAFGESVAIPISSVPCGRPDILTYAALVDPANGQKNVPLTARTFFVEVAGIAGEPVPFEPVLNAHIVVNALSTVDASSPLTPATPPPDSTAPSPPPQSGQSIGYEAGSLPQLEPGSTYTIYLYDDACEAPWNAGSFST